MSSGAFAYHARTPAFNPFFRFQCPDLVKGPSKAPLAGADRAKKASCDFRICAVWTWPLGQAWGRGGGRPFSSYSLWGASLALKA